MLKLPKWMREVGWRTVVGAVLLGGIMHIGATLAVPLLGPGNAFPGCATTCPSTAWWSCRRPRRASSRCRSWRPTRSTPCAATTSRVDSLAVSAALAEPGWTLSLHTPQGDNFYVMPAQQLRRSEVSLRAGAGRIDRLSSSRRRRGA